MGHDNGPASALLTQTNTRHVVAQAVFHGHLRVFPWCVGDSLANRADWDCQPSREYLDGTVARIRSAFKES